MSELCAIVLAAGEGRRLRPLTELRPKALCPVGNVTLLDRALARVDGLGLPVAVNACYLAEQVVDHLAGRDRAPGHGDGPGRVHVTVEPGAPWGTSGGVARLREWADGRGVLVANADAYLADPTRPPGPDVAALLAGWAGDTVRILGVPGGREFADHRFAGFSLLPWKIVRDLPVERAELVRTAWRPAERAGRLEVIGFGGTYLDTGTPADYLAANLHAAAGGALVDPSATVTGRVEHAVVGAGARVAGTVRDAVVWPDATVTADETLVGAVRAGAALTVR